MKNILFLLGLVITSQAFANNAADGKTYNALDVTPVPTSGPDDGGFRQMKAVGGYACTESHAVVRHPVSKYECHFMQGARIDYKAIYNALKVKEKKTPQSLDGGRGTMKKVGGLECTHTTTLVSKGTIENYECVGQKATGLLDADTKSADTQSNVSNRNEKGPGDDKSNISGVDLHEDSHAGKVSDTPRFYR